MPKWPEMCKRSSKRSNGLPCEKPAIPGGYVCRWHGGNVGRIREAAWYRYVTWVVTGCPEHRFYDVAMKGLTRHLLMNTKLTDEQMLKLADLVLG
jgi:hypothetical protein